MKTYTIEDIANFEKDECGRLICPSGDYSQIESFDEWCIFGNGSIFGKGSRFGKWCRFGEGCSFSVGCRFDEECRFDEGCSFGKGCRFSKRCSFDKRCSFGEWCNLNNNLKFENIADVVVEVLKIDRIGSRKGCTYFFKTKSEIYVRCGCFFGTISEFEAKVLTTHANNEKYKSQYIGAILYAKNVLGYSVESDKNDGQLFEKEISEMSETVEALRKARNLLQRYKDHIKSYPCECKFGLDFYGNKTPFRDGEMCERCAELAEIDKAIGGKEDEKE